MLTIYYRPSAWLYDPFYIWARGLPRPCRPLCLRPPCHSQPWLEFPTTPMGQGHCICVLLHLGHIARSEGVRVFFISVKRVFCQYLFTIVVRSITMIWTSSLIVITVKLDMTLCWRFPKSSNILQTLIDVGEVLYIILSVTMSRTRSWVRFASAPSCYLTSHPGNLSCFILVAPSSEYE